MSHNNLPVDGGDDSNSDRRDELSSWKKTRYRSRRGRQLSFHWFNEIINETLTSSLYWASAETRGTVTCPLFTVHKSTRWFIDDDGSSGSFFKLSYARFIGFIRSSVERLIRSQAHDCRPAWAIINSHGIIARVFVRTTLQWTALISWACITRGRMW